MPSTSFAGLVREFRSKQRLFDTDSISRQETILSLLATKPLGSVLAVKMYHEALLYSLAYPATENVRDVCSQELTRIARFVASLKTAERTRFDNSGIAGSTVEATLSLTLNNWLITRYPGASRFSSEIASERVLVQTLGLLFDPVEQEMLHAGKTAWKFWAEQMSGQGKHPHKFKRWIVETTNRLPGSIALKESVFSQFETTTSWRTSADAPSLTTGRVEHGTPFIHTGGLKRTVSIATQVASKPVRLELTPKQKEDLVDLARGVLVTLNRETDPVTFANVAETEYYDMGRGLGIALYAMVPDMKMSVQSYIGFFAFKNHVPCAYGGGWVLNRESFFGVNVFPPFRGGESALIVADLLRLYHHAFNVELFSVDPYQIGHGNPDGIKSRSFWFYYRLGFRPLEPELRKLARDEFRKMKTTVGYHSSVTTLKVLAGATMRWNVGKVVNDVPLSADRLGDLVTSFVNSRYDGDRQLALTESMKVLNARIGNRLTKQHAIARIVVLLNASGFLGSASKTELKLLTEDYSMKFENERAYIVRSQRHQTLFSALGSAERLL